ncbi:MAG TPA: DNA polymerase ligase N-terminal domain-containing protein [Gemmatimonadales bacterium]|nr:DNA polymerase ligase N-terminal domain-containing protein [Gemmatimonadales bacterium]
MLLATEPDMATTRKTTSAKRTAAKRATKSTGDRSSATGRPSASKRSASKRSASKRSASKGGAATRSGTKAPARRTSTKAARSSSRAAVPLAEYNAKRDFSRTREPAGRVPKARGATLHFVIQKHEASHLHYDFRLELDGVMKSWAVPKGPSLDPSVRRLAMEVEDHPISYNTFEGTIPEGEYGGGTVMLWDRGTYEAEDGGGVESLRRGYEKGDLKFVLHGKRLQGGWVLVRMQRPGRPQWLLIKHRDRYADSKADVTRDNTTSVTTRRTMDQIASGRRVWHSNR